MFSLSMFGPFRCSVFRGSIPFEVRSFDIQSFDDRSHSTFSLSMFGPIRGLVFRCSVLFDVRSFEVRSFDIQSFEVRSFEVRSFEVRSRFQLSYERVVPQANLLIFRVISSEIFLTLQRKLEQFLEVFWETISRAVENWNIVSLEIRVTNSEKTVSV
jgi:hypothetical protein